MKRAVIITVVAALVLIGFAPLGLAASQPSQGINSFDRNESGFEGPHCHVLIVDSGQSQWDSVVVYPSHKGHANSGIGHIFAADLDCNGVAG